MVGSCNRTLFPFCGRIVVKAHLGQSRLVSASHVQQDSLPICACFAWCISGSTRLEWWLWQRCHGCVKACSSGVRACVGSEATLSWSARVHSLQEVSRVFVVFAGVGSSETVLTALHGPSNLPLLQPLLFREAQKHVTIVEGPLHHPKWGRA